MFAYVYSCSPMFIFVTRTCLPTFTNFYLGLPIITHVYSCLPMFFLCSTMFNHVYLCLPMFTHAWWHNYVTLHVKRYHLAQEKFLSFLCGVTSTAILAHWWRFHSLGTSRCLVTVLHSQDSPKLIIGEKRIWIINLNFCISPCKVNKMSSSSLQCMPCCFGALLGSNNSRYETGSCDSCVVSSVGWVRMWLGRATRFYLEQRYVSEWLTYYKHGDDCPLT